MIVTEGEVVFGGDISYCDLNDKIYTPTYYIRKNYAEEDEDPTYTFAIIEDAQ